MRCHYTWRANHYPLLIPVSTVHFLRRTPCVCVCKLSRMTARIINCLEMTFSSAGLARVRTCTIQNLRLSDPELSYPPLLAFSGQRPAIHMCRLRVGVSRYCPKDFFHHPGLSV